MSLDSELLRTFLAVVDTGNFTRAGETVGLTQSAVSLQIKRLEETLDARLFERGPRGVVLARQGEPLVAHARRVIALLDEASRAMRGPAFVGDVRIGIPEEYSHTVLPMALGAFTRLHPLAEVTVRHAPSAAHRAAIQAGALDIAVVFEASGSRTAEWLATDPTVWASSERYNVHEQDPVPIALNEPNDWCRQLTINSLEDAGIRFRIAYSSNSSSALLAAAASGLAIAALSRSHIPPGCRELGVADGYTVIDASDVGLLVRSTATCRTIFGMAEAIRDAFRTIGGLRVEGSQHDRMEVLPDYLR